MLLSMLVVLPLALPAQAASSPAAQQIIRDYSACLIQRAPSYVDRFLKLPPASREVLELADKHPEKDCMYPGEINFAPLGFRGSLYEALYARDFSGAALPDPAALPKLDYRAGFAGDDAAAVAKQVTYLDFADCVIRGNAVAARDAVRSAPASAAEVQAFQALQPAMSACIVEGRSFRAGRTVLRGLLAEALYRMSLAASSMSPMHKGG